MSIGKKDGLSARALLLCWLAMGAVETALAQLPHQPLAEVTQQDQRLSRSIRSAAGDTPDLPSSALGVANPRIFSRSRYSHALKPSAANSPSVSSPSGTGYNVNSADILQGTGWTVLGSTEHDAKNGQQNTACPQKCQKWDPVSKACRLDFACHLRGGTDASAPDNAQMSIIKAAGCPSCHLSDYSGKCRVILSCLLGARGN